MADNVEAAEASQAPQADPLSVMYEKSFEEMRHLISCKVCVQPMYEPYTIACGHTFCYSCLVQWFETNKRNKTCPECRNSVTRQPAPAYIVRELTRLFSAKSELLAHGETTREHEDLRTTEAAVVSKDRENTSGTSGGLFRGLFRAARPDSIGYREPLIDLEDNVRRCPYCQWELESDYCYHCEVTMMHHIDDESSRGSSIWSRPHYETEIMARYVDEARRLDGSLDSNMPFSSDELNSNSDPDSLSDDSDHSLDGFIDHDEMLSDRDSDHTDAASPPPWRSSGGSEPDQASGGSLASPNGFSSDDSDHSSRPSRDGSFLPSGAGFSRTIRWPPVAHQSGQAIRRSTASYTVEQNNSSVALIANGSHHHRERHASHGPAALGADHAAETSGGSESEEETAREDDEDEEIEEEEEEEGAGGNDARIDPAEPAITHVDRRASRKRRRAVVEDSSSEEEEEAPIPIVRPSAPSDQQRAASSQQPARLARRARNRSNRNSPQAISQRAQGLFRSRGSVAQVQ